MIARCTCCLLVCIAWSACLPDNACDEGYSESTGICVKDTKASTRDAAAAEDEDDGGLAADAATSVTHDYTHFGDKCATNDDCKAPASTCIGPLMYCSRTQCADDPSICPPDFSCKDISAASPNPDVTHICLKK